MSHIIKCGKLSLGVLLKDAQLYWGILAEVERPHWLWSILMMDRSFRI
jgi:hypothetical protein